MLYCDGTTGVVDGKHAITMVHRRLLDIKDLPNDLLYELRNGLPLVTYQLSASELQMKEARSRSPMAHH